MWSSELAKLREKGSSSSSSASASADHQGSTQQVVPSKEAAGGKLFGGKLQGFIQEMRVNSAVLLLPRSEASVSMIVECVSP